MEDTIEATGTVLWRIRVIEEDDAVDYALDQDGVEQMVSEESASLVMYIFAASKNDADPIEWPDGYVGAGRETVGESKQAYIDLAQRIAALGRA